MGKFLDFISKIAVTDHGKRQKAITDELDRIGVDYRIQGNGGIENILVSFNPTEDRTVVFAHYDAAPQAPGANDNGAGCSILLDLVEKYKDTDKSIDFVFTDMEERGWRGSTCYIEEIGADNIDTGINLDMCGQGEHIVICEPSLPRLGLTNTATGESACVFQISLENYPILTRMVSDELTKKYGVKIADNFPGGDQEAFRENNLPFSMAIASTEHDLDFYLGKGGSMFDCDFMDTMHQPTDTPDLINEEIVEKIANYVAEAIG